MTTVYCNHHTTTLEEDGSISIPISLEEPCHQIQIVHSQFPNLALSIPHDSLLHWSTADGQYTATIPAAMYTPATLCRALQEAIAGEMTDSYVLAQVQQEGLVISSSLSRRAEWEGAQAMVVRPEVREGDQVRVGAEIYRIQSLVEGGLVLDRAPTTPGEIYFYYPITWHGTQLSDSLGLTTGVPAHTHRSTGLDLQAVDHLYLRLGYQRPGSDSVDPLRTQVNEGEGPVSHLLAPVIFGPQGGTCPPVTVTLDRPTTLRRLHLLAVYPDGTPAPLEGHLWHLTLQLV